MTWRNYYPYILNRKEVFHLTLFHSYAEPPPREPQVELGARRPMPAEGEGH